MLLLLPLPLPLVVVVVVVVMMLLLPPPPLLLLLLLPQRVAWGAINVHWVHQENLCTPLRTGWLQCSSLFAVAIRWKPSILVHSSH